ncbi:MAG: M1 family metallopeptidase, partial [Cyclobacteriaceae bacterium]
MKLLSFLLFLTFTAAALAQDQYPKNPNVDIQNYSYTLFLNDSTNEIRGEARIEALIEPGTEKLSFDLVAKNSNGTGMMITEVIEEDIPATYSYRDDRLEISPLPDLNKERVFHIRYHGIPERGLVIDTTKYGERSFFGDNWPNLARHWLPSVDHPYDKASVTFSVIAPEYYDVVATGKKVEESNLDNGYKLTRYYEPAPVATKVMTIGVTRFASSTLGFVGDIEISAWVYPENRLEGFNDYAPAVEVMEYFTGNIGPYPWAKLANMQAKTQWGGLENAGTIAYRESSVTGQSEVEDLIAHEVAHQWFGNSATEANWNHVWLSEGFATYFTVLYLENKYGKERRISEMKQDRDQVIVYATTIVDPMNVLSTNTYQKGGWALHMLRRKLGDDVFWEGIRTYYANYAYSNALTPDFRAVMEAVSGQDLKPFFRQWLYGSGFPVLDTDWQYTAGKLILNLKQVQDQPAFS